MGLATICVSYSNILWLSLVFLAATGFAMMIAMASSNTILQTIVEDDKRGRVMSLYATAFFSGAVGKSAGRRPGQQHRRAGDDCPVGRDLPGGFRGLCHQAAHAEEVRAADLRAGRNPFGRAGGRPVNRETDRAAGSLSVWSEPLGTVPSTGYVQPEMAGTPA